MALIALYKTDMVLQPWMTFVAYQGLNILTSSVVMFGNRWIPMINKFSCKSNTCQSSEQEAQTNYPKWFTFNLPGSSPWSQSRQRLQRITMRNLCFEPG